MLILLNSCHWRCGIIDTECRSLRAEGLHLIHEKRLKEKHRYGSQALGMGIGGQNQVLEKLNIVKLI